MIRWKEIEEHKVLTEDEQNELTILLEEFDVFDTETK